LQPNVKLVLYILHAMKPGMLHDLTFLTMDVYSPHRECRAMWPRPELCRVTHRGDCVWSRSRGGHLVCCHRSMGATDCEQRGVRCNYGMLPPLHARASSIQIPPGCWDSPHPCTPHPKSAALPSCGVEHTPFTVRICHKSPHTLSMHAYSCGSTAMRSLSPARWTRHCTSTSKRSTAHPHRCGT
jgi:hypothetical protein